jgi:hypothetical protein
MIFSPPGIMNRWNVGFTLNFYFSICLTKSYFFIILILLVLKM